MPPRAPRQGQFRGQRSAPRLGLGEFVLAGEVNPFARKLYLEAVGRCVPQALRELEAIDLEDEAALKEWAERRGFTDPWALAAARQHAQFRPDYPGATGWLGALAAARWEPVFPGGPSWDPLGGETEAEFRRRVDAYVKALKATPTLARTPEKDSLQPFERLALYQVGHVQPGELAENRNGDDALSLSAISESLRDTAKLVGLTLRRGRRGPRRKTSVNTTTS